MAEEGEVLAVEMIEEDSKEKMIGKMAQVKALALLAV